MNRYFENMVFADELKLWNYSQRFKDMSLDVEDGHYCVEMSESNFQLQYRCLIRFTALRRLREVLYHRPNENPRVYIYVKDGKAFCIGLSSATFKAHEELNSQGLWEVKFYRDRMSEAQPQKRQFTNIELAASCNALVELLIMNSKKVS